MSNNKKYVSLSKLQTFLENLSNKFATLSHKHTIVDLIDYTVDTALSPTSNNPVANSTINTEFDAVSDAMRALELAIDGKADASHNHDSVYYTETEVDNLLSQKSQVQIVTQNIHESLPVLTIHKVTQEEYDEKLTNGTIDANALYLTPDEEIDLTPYATIEQLNDKADLEHTHTIDEVTNLQSSLDEILENSKDYTNSAISTKADTAHNHDSDYDTKGAAADSLASANSYTDTKVANLASTSAVDTKITTHNTSTDAHNDIRDLITGLTTRLNTLADSDDTTLDQMSELVAYIKSNKELIDGVTTSKVNVSDIVNNLTTNVTNKPLSASQGVAIKVLIDALQAELDSHTHTVSDISDLTATATELNYMSGMTANVKAQLDNKAPKANPDFTGSISLDRLSSGTVGNSSVAVGYKNTASGSFSFAEGCSTTASGYASHAGGNGTTASGSESFAIGSNSKAQGDSSVAMGDGNTAVAECSFVHGGYSVTDTNGDYAHIVGVGMANKRANGYTLDWDGNGWFAGDVYVGSTSGTNKDEGSVKLLKEGDAASVIIREW